MRIVKVIRVLEGERYTACSPAGTGYMSATADENGFEIDDRGAVFWITDAQLDAAIQERNRTAQMEDATESVEPESTEPSSSPSVATMLVADCAEAKDRYAARVNERCPRCEKVGSKGPCSFDCATCHRCKKPIADGAIRLFTTGDHVYCMDCGTHA